MATFYKYAERSADSQVNWAEIGKDMTDMLRQEVTVREQKKAAIDEATRKLAQEVSNAPQGESESAKAEAIRLADQVTKYMLQQEKLLKSGLLDPKDYMVSRQNLTDGTRQAYQTMKEFQTRYGELMEGVRKGTTSIISVKELEKIQGYGNFRQSGFFIDAPTGKLNVGLKEEQTINGQKVIGLKPGSTVGMQYIQGGIYGVRDVYDYRKDITELSKSLGEEIRVTLDPATMRKLGTATTLSDLQQRVIKIAGETPGKEKELFNFYDAMAKAIGGYLVNENNLSSLLADTMGYEWTDDPEVSKKNPKSILGGVDPNTGQPNVTVADEASQAAKDFMMQQFLGTINVKESIQGMGQVQDQSRPPTESQRKDVENKNVLSNVAKLYYGTDAEVQEASDFLRSFNPTIDTIDRSGNNITITYTDGRPPEVRAWKSESGELLDQEGWVTANTNFFLPEGNRIGNVKELINRGGIDKTRQFNAASTGFSAGTTQEKEGVDEAFKRVIARDLKITPEVFVADDDAATKAKLSGIIAATPGLSGLTIETGVSGDRIILMDGESEIGRFELDDMTDEQAADYTNQLLELASSRATTDQKATKIQGERTTSAPQQRTSGRTSNQAPR